MSDEPTDAEVRDAAVCLIAAETVLGDELSAEAALTQVRRIESALDEEPWANGQHSGDCTKRAHTCIRCMFERAEARARELYG